MGTPTIIMASLVRSLRDRAVKTAQSVLPRTVAAPKLPPGLPTEQAPNRLTTWSENQNPRSEAMTGPRFEQTNYKHQPRPLAAIELIAQEPIRMVGGRVAVCDGGDGALGHPKVFINLDKPGAHPCTYCGLRFEQDVAHSH